jgi:hypothetical protein
MRDRSEQGWGVNLPDSIFAFQDQGAMQEWKRRIETNKLDSQTGIA